MYWAGGNIGACRGVEGFRAHHQIPYRRAFPGAAGAGHFLRVEDGPFAATGGDVAVRHTGADYMGIAATGLSMRFRVMDFYRFDADGLIAENWLPNDTIGLMAQMGVDVMARARHLAGEWRRKL
jgi:predicted ester cyclase